MGPHRRSVLETRSRGISRRQGSPPRETREVVGPKCDARAPKRGALLTVKSR
jgi:hypothetical protein